jgi:hypothetical protein
VVSEPPAFHLRRRGHREGERAAFVRPRAPPRRHPRAYTLMTSHAVI